MSIATSDGARLAATLFEPETPPRGTLLVAPAVGGPQTFYARFARFIASKGLRAVTFDYRGFAGSKRSGGPTPTLSRWGELDYPAVLRWVMARPDRGPCYVVGHSLGGQFLGLTPEAQSLAGAATVASMSGNIRNLEHGRRRAEWTFRYLVPAITAALPDVPGWLGLGATIPSPAMREWARWCLSQEYFLSEHPEYRARAAQFTRPLTILSFEDDRLAPLVNVRWLVDFYADARPRHVHLRPAEVGLAGIGHFGFFRDSSRVLWASLLDQLQRHDPSYDPQLLPRMQLHQDMMLDLQRDF